MGETKGGESENMGIKCLDNSSPLFASHTTKYIGDSFAKKKKRKKREIRGKKLLLETSIEESFL